MSRTILKWEWEDGHVIAVAMAIRTARDRGLHPYWADWEQVPELIKEHYLDQARAAMDAAFNWPEAQPYNEQGSASPEMPGAPPDRSTE